MHVNNSPCLVCSSVAHRYTIQLLFLIVSLVAQAEKPRNNKIITIKLANIHRMKTDDSDEELEDDEDDEGADDNETGTNAPHFHSASIAHQGGINRFVAIHFVLSLRVFFFTL